MFLKDILSRFLPTLLILSLASPPASGKPIPSQTITNPSNRERRFLSGNGGLKTWEIIVIVIGAVIAIMLIGGLGGACEVLLHTRGKIVQSNAEADAKVENGSSSRAFEEEGEDDKEGGVGSDASTEVGAVDASHFSWQPEKMTAGEDMPDDRALSEAETTGDSEATLNGEQSSVEGGEGSMHAHGVNGDMPAAEPSDTEFSQEQTRDRVLPWEDHTHPDPALAHFVIGEEEGPGYEGDQAASYDHHEDHFVGTAAMPDEADFQPEHTPSSYGHHEEMDTWHHETHPGQREEEPIDHTHEHIGEALSVAPVGEYSGQGYSPAAMPDEGDYLAEYRQSQVYLQQEDDWQQYYASSHGASRTEGQHDEHDEHERVALRPDPGYF
ncbi:hypothetical protein VP1G_06759 [Cytospora mali]|uniref:Uncharacterized protein n=1 Tax=Cytospora mali TaxID=578113 RepID=A0A194V6D9_CYTMA|nr:hypothetical protein VP1G_06759 [Valsa mali var. pyri (nom. inval.)]